MIDYSEYVFYLISKYRGREWDSNRENIQAWLTLSQKGYHVYSPIATNHNIELYRVYGKSGFESFVPNYLQEDLFYVRKFITNPGHYYITEHSYCSDCGKEIHWEHTRHEIQLCCGKSYYRVLSDLGDPYRQEKHEHHVFGTGMVAVVLPSAMDTIQTMNRTDKSVTKEELLVLYSDLSAGAMEEYDEFRLHHMLTLPYEVILNVPEKQWEMHNLYDV